MSLFVKLKVAAVDAGQEYLKRRHFSYVVC